MTIILFGKNGQLGTALCAANPDIKAFDRSYVDLNNPDHIRAVISDTKPDIIINAAAYTAVDQAEQDPATADAVNHLAVACMADEALRHNALLVTYSTDYVFDGKKDGPYTEGDTPAPLNIYGTTKYAGEQAVIVSGCRHLILRTSWLYSDTPGNFAGKIIAAAQKNAELSVVDDQIGAPTHVKALVDATFKLLQTQTANGLYHCAATGFVSRAEWARHIIQKARLETKVIPVKTADRPSMAARPLNSQLSSQKLLDEYGIIMPPWNA